MWDTYTEKKLRYFRLVNEWVLTCSFSPSGNYIASAGMDHTCSIYSLKRREGDNSVTQRLENDTVMYCCRFVDDSHMLTCSDTTCCLWDIETGQRLISFQGHTYEVLNISLAPDGRTFLSGASDSLAKLWDIRDGTCRQTFAGHTEDVNSVSYFPSGYGCGTGSDDGTCCLFDMRMENEPMRYSHDDVTSGINSVAFSSSGRLLFAGQNGTLVNVWDTVTAECVFVLRDHFSHVSCLGVSPDGMALATGSWDCTVRIWN